MLAAFRRVPTAAALSLRQFTCTEERVQGAVKGRKKERVPAAFEGGRKEGIRRTD